MEYVTDLGNMMPYSVAQGACQSGTGGHLPHESTVSPEVQDTGYDQGKVTEGDGKNRSPDAKAKAPNKTDKYKDSYDGSQG